jgi:ABC-type multidrug transport system permease subunit
MNINRVMANLVVHIKQFSREKSTIFFVLAFPILLMLLFGFIFSDQGNIAYNLPIQNNDGGYWSTNLTDTLNKTGVFNVILVDSSEDPKEYMNASGENTLLIIPAGFSEQINSTHTTYYYLGEALMANSEAMNHTLMALNTDLDSLNYSQRAMNNSISAMDSLALATNPYWPWNSYNTLMAMESTGNAINYTGMALNSTGDVLFYTNQALVELGNAMNYTIEAMTYEVVPNPALNLTVHYDPSVSLSQTKVQILNTIIDGYNKGFSGAKDIIDIEELSTQSVKFKFIDFFAPGIIAMSVMSSSLFGTVGMNTELRQKGILRKLATTPLTRAEWLLSNILYQMFMAMLSTACILGVGMGIFGLQPQINVFMIMFILLCVFSFAGIAMLITRFVKEAESAQAAANAVMFPMMFLSGTFFQLEMMPGFLQAIARFLPLYYVNEGLRASMITLDNNMILQNAVVIGIFGMAVFIVGVFLTSWKDE